MKKTIILAMLTLAQFAVANTKGFNVTVCKNVNYYGKAVRFQATFSQANNDSSEVTYTTSQPASSATLSVETRELNVQQLIAADQVKFPSQSMASRFIPTRAVQLSHNGHEFATILMSINDAVVRQGDLFLGSTSNCRK
jgi:hypothetical protein